MRYGKYKGVIHYVFDNEHDFSRWFKGEPPAISRDWRNAQVGEWVWSDDGRIVEILKRSPPKGCKYYFVLTIVGTFANRQRDFMDTDFSKHESRYSLSGKLTKQWGRHKDFDKLTNAEKIFVATLIATGKPYESFRSAFPKAKSEDYIYQKLVYLLGRDKIMDQIRKSVAESAEKSGINVEWIFKMLKDLGEKAKNEHVRLQSVQTAGCYLEVEPKAKTQPQFPVHQGLIMDAEVEEVAGTEQKQLEANT